MAFASHIQLKSIFLQLYKHIIFTFSFLDYNVLGLYSFRPAKDREDHLSQGLLAHLSLLPPLPTDSCHAAQGGSSVSHKEQAGVETRWACEPQPSVKARTKETGQQ